MGRAINQSLLGVNERTNEYNSEPARLANAETLDFRQREKSQEVSRTSNAHRTSHSSAPTMTAKLNVYDLDPPALRAYLMENFSVPKYRADQVAAWLYQKKATSYDAMSNLPAALRADLDAKVCACVYVCV